MGALSVDGRLHQLARHSRGDGISFKMYLCESPLAEAAFVPIACAVLILRAAPRLIDTADCF